MRCYWLNHNRKMVKPRHCQTVERDTADSLQRARSWRVQESISANLELHKLLRKVKKFCQKWCWSWGCNYISSSCFKLWNGEYNHLTFSMQSYNGESKTIRHSQYRWMEEVVGKYIRILRTLRTLILWKLAQIFESLLVYYLLAFIQIQVHRSWCFCCKFYESGNCNSR